MTKSEAVRNFLVKTFYRKLCFYGTKLTLQTKGAIE